MAENILDLYALAKHQIDEVYPAVHNPRLFIGVLKLIERIHTELSQIQGQDQQRLKEIKDILKKYEESNTNFPRDDQIIIADGDFELHKITLAYVEEVLKETKVLIDNMH